jgi:hypothetical protein
MANFAVAWMAESDQCISASFCGQRRNSAAFGRIPTLLSRLTALNAFVAPNMAKFGNIAVK